MSPTPPKQEIAPDSFEKFDDFEAYRKTLTESMRRADEILGMHRRGLTKKEREKLKDELPILVQTLRQLLEAQLESNGIIAKLDRSDGSYDNASVDNKLRIQLGKLRDMSIELNRMIGTRTVRKVSAWITEDLPNWFSVRWEQAKDNMKHLLKGVAVVGGLSAGGAILGYSLATGGFVPGVTLLGQHLAQLASWVGTNVPIAYAATSGAITSLWKRITGEGMAPVAAAPAGA
jgi:hypothetical protein